MSEPEEWYDDDIVAEMHLQLEVANLKSRVNRYESAWKEVCALAQQNCSDGFLNPVNPYALLDVFNRMKMDLLHLEGCSGNNFI